MNQREHEDIDRMMCFVVSRRSLHYLVSDGAAGGSSYLQSKQRCWTAAARWASSDCSWVCASVLYLLAVTSWWILKFRAFLHVTGWSTVGLWSLSSLMATSWNQLFPFVVGVLQFSLGSLSSLAWPALERTVSKSAVLYPSNIPPHTLSTCNCPCGLGSLLLSTEENHFNCWFLQSHSFSWYPNPWPQIRVVW